MPNTKEYFIKIGDNEIPYIIKESSKAKNIRLVIDNNGLHIVKPKKVAIGEVDRVLKDKSTWIFNHYKKLIEAKKCMPERKWITGETLLYLGQSYMLNITEHNKIDNNNLSNIKKGIISVNFDGDAFNILMDEKTTGEERNILVESILKKWYKRAADSVIYGRLEHFCRITGLRYKAVRFKEQKTRWGSCSKAGNLNFNWKLVMAPLWVVDYVVLHEVCHLRHLNHSKDFWNMVEYYMPQYKKAQEWLKNNGAKLTFSN